MKTEEEKKRERERERLRLLNQRRIATFLRMRISLGSDIPPQPSSPIEAHTGVISVQGQVATPFFPGVARVEADPGVIDVTGQTAGVFQSSGIEATYGEISVDGQPGVISGEGPLITDMPTLTFTNATGSVPVMAGVVFEKGKASGSVVPDVAGLYLTPKRLWNDGSIKHAVISGVCPVDTEITFVEGTASGTNLAHADIVTANPSAVVDLDTYGSISLATLLASPPFRTWISTPGMVECHYVWAVPDTSMLVWFHVRLWSDDSCWVRVLIENAPLVRTTNVDETYDATITIDGTAVRTLTGYTHYMNTAYAESRWIGSTQHDIWPVHDTAYIQATGLTPLYGMVASINEDDMVAKVPTSLAFNSIGEYTANMGNSGYQDQLGLLPDWEAKYLVSGDTRGYQCTMAHLGAALMYPLAWRHPTTKEILKPSDYPTANLNGVGGTGVTDVEGLPTANWDIAHNPSMGYLAYLVSGDYWALEVMLGHTALMYQATLTTMGDGIERILRIRVRATAWCLRGLGQAAAIMPGDHPNLDDMQGWLNNNIAEHRSYTVEDATAADSNIGYPWTKGCEGDEIGLPLEGKVWMENFWVQVMGYLSEMDPMDDTDMAAFIELRNWMYRFVIGILGTADTFCYTYAGSEDEVVITPVLCTSTGFELFAPDFYTEWSDVWDGTHPGVTDCGTTLLGYVTAQSYWANLVPAIQYAMKHAQPGATTAWARVLSADNASNLINADWSLQTPWAIKYPIDPPPAPPDDWPAWRTAMTNHTWANPGDNTLADIDPEDDPLVNPNYPADAPWHAISGQTGAVQSWDGACWMETERRLRIWGGGHANYAGNETYDWDAQTATFILRTNPTGAIGNEGLLDDNLEATCLYFDGQPRSRHTYAMFADRQGVTWQFGGSMYRSPLGSGTTFWHMPTYFTGTGWVRDDDQPLYLNFGGSCYDSTRDLFWVIRNGNGIRFKTYDPVAKVVAEVPKSVDIGNGEVFLHYDETLDIIVAVAGLSTASPPVVNIRYFVPSTLLGMFTPTINGTPPPAWYGGKAGWTFDSDNHRLLVWVGGTSIYELQLPVSDPTDPWTWSIITADESNSVTPTSPQPNGTYGRFWYSSHLKCAGVVNDIAQKMYVFAMD